MNFTSRYGRLLFLFGFVALTNHFIIWNEEILIALCFGLFIFTVRRGFQGSIAAFLDDRRQSIQAEVDESFHSVVKALQQKRSQTLQNLSSLSFLKFGEETLQMSEKGLRFGSLETQSSFEIEKEKRKQYRKLKGS